MAEIVGFEFVHIFHIFVHCCFGYDYETEVFKKKLEKNDIEVFLDANNGFGKIFLCILYFSLLMIFFVYFKIVPRRCHYEYFSFFML